MLGHRWGELFGGRWDGDAWFSGAFGEVVGDAVGLHKAPDVGPTLGADFLVGLAVRGFKAGEGCVLRGAEPNRMIVSWFHSGLTNFRL